MNTVQITGNLAKANGDTLDLTDWVNVTAWGKLAEAVGNELTKGNYVFIEGRYSTRSYDTPDGQRRYITEVVANMIAKPIGRNMKSSEVPFSEPVKFEDMGTVTKEYAPPEYEQGEIPF